MNATMQYRDSRGQPISAEAIRSDPDALDKTYHFHALRPAPTEPNVIGFIEGVPVVKAADLGESSHTPLMRDVAYLVPGDDRVKHTLLDAVCTVPRYRSPRDGYPAHYVVLTVSNETLDAIAQGVALCRA